MVCSVVVYKCALSVVLVCVCSVGVCVVLASV